MGHGTHRRLEEGGGGNCLVHRLTSVLGLRKEICEGHSEVCPRRLGENYYQAITRGFLGEET